MRDDRPKKKKENQLASREGMRRVMHRMSSEPIVSNGASDRLDDLIRGCQEGDRAAQHGLYEMCHQEVFQLMVRMVGPQDAADLTQDVFLQAFRKIDTFAGRSRFQTWLYRLAVNESLQQLRRQRRQQRLPLEEDPEDHATGHETHTQHKELLDQALARLEPDLRSVFLLRELEKLPYHEIAQAAGVPEGTVASRLNRARRLLQKYLVDLGWEP
jgi:RNA polymerase sigma-70 factor (ECF subfamily)